MKKQTLFILVVGFLFLGCNPQEKSNPTQLVVSSSIGSAFFTPYYATSSYDRSVTDLVYQSLYKVNEQGELIEQVAQGQPTISNNGLVYIIKLHPNNYFSNGDLLTAFNVEHSYKLLANPLYVGPNQFYTEGIRRVEALDNQTVQFTFRQNAVSNPMLLLFPLVHISYGEEQLTKLDLQFDPLGSGPYFLKEYQAGQSILLEVNPYIERNKPKITRIKILKNHNDSDISQLVNGQVDLVSGVSQKAKIDAAQIHHITTQYYPRAGYNALFLNTQYGATQNLKVRQALNYGLNRQFFQKSYLGDMAIDLLAPVNPQWTEYSSSLEAKLNTYAYNPDLANKLLEDEGYMMQADGYRYKNGRLLEITLLTSLEGAIMRSLLPIITSNYQDLGIKLYVVKLDAAQLASELAKPNSPYNMISQSIFEESRPYLTYKRFYSLEETPTIQNLSRLNESKNQALSHQMKEASTTEEFTKAFEAYQIHLNQLAPFIMLNGSLYADLYNHRLKNFKTSSSWTWRDQVPFIEFSS